MLQCVGLQHAIIPFAMLTCAVCSACPAALDIASANDGLKCILLQVVVVAAGFDTRAYRIGAKYKDVHFFEVDLPHASQ